MRLLPWQWVIETVFLPTSGQSLIWWSSPQLKHLMVILLSLCGKRGYIQSCSTLLQEAIKGLNVLTASPQSGSVCLPRMAPYTPENSYMSQGHASLYTPQKAIPQIWLRKHIFTQPGRSQNFSSLMLPTTLVVGSTGYWTFLEWSHFTQ